MNCTEKGASGLVVAGGDTAVLLESIEEIFDQMARLVQVSVVLAEELGYAGDVSFGWHMHAIVAHYLLNQGTEAQKKKSCQACHQRNNCRDCHVRAGHGFGLEEYPYDRREHANGYLLNGAKIFIDRCIVDMMEGRMDTVLASMDKNWISDLQCKVIDKCFQLFGGYGYMLEYSIAQMYADARVQRIYGGANKNMKGITARSLLET